MKVVILAGGEGTRLREKTTSIPKPLVEIGGLPLLWHIMKIYSHYGYKEFIICLGYKGKMIKEYFMKNESWKSADFTLEMEKSKATIKYHDVEQEDWIIHFVDTGPKTETGGRINRIKHLIDEDTFLCTYGDGVSDVPIPDVVKFHKKQGKIATMTCINPRSQFGIIKLDENNNITNYIEKPKLDTWVNGGFFVFNKKIFDYLNDDIVLEKEPFEKLAKDNQFNGFKFDGFWKCMDTFKDNQALNDYWYSQKVPWKVWK